MLSLDELKELQREGDRGVRRPGADQLDGGRSPTRPVGPPSTALGDVAEYISFGASPRGPISARRGGACPRAHPRPRLRRAGRPRGARPRCVPPPSRPLVPRARRRGRARTRCSTACSPRCRCRRSTSAARTTRSLTPLPARTPEQPGPGPLSTASLRALELVDRPPGRRPARRRLPVVVRRRRQRAVAGASVRARRRRPSHRVERHRADRASRTCASSSPSACS